jgi:hypothetical protein
VMGLSGWHIDKSHLDQASTRGCSFAVLFPDSSRAGSSGWGEGLSATSSSRQLPAGFLRPHNRENKPRKAPKHEQKPDAPSPIAHTYQKRTRP